MRPMLEQGSSRRARTSWMVHGSAGVCARVHCVVCESVRSIERGHKRQKGVRGVTIWISRVARCYLLQYRGSELSRSALPSRLCPPASRRHCRVAPACRTIYCTHANVVRAFLTSLESRHLPTHLLSVDLSCLSHVSGCLESVCVITDLGLQYTSHSVTTALSAHTTDHRHRHHATHDHRRSSFFVDRTSGARARPALRARRPAAGPPPRLTHTSCGHVAPRSARVSGTQRHSPRTGRTHTRDVHHRTPRRAAPLRAQLELQTVCRGASSVARAPGAPGCVGQRGTATLARSLGIAGPSRLHVAARLGVRAGLCA